MRRAALLAFLCVICVACFAGCGGWNPFAKNNLSGDWTDNGSYIKYPSGPDEEVIYVARHCNKCGHEVRLPTPEAPEGPVVFETPTPTPTPTPKPRPRIKVNQATCEAKKCRWESGPCCVCPAPAAPADK